jgi:hypothetical protein
MRPWKWGRHGARLKDWQLTEPSGGISQMPYAPQVATGIKKNILTYHQTTLHVPPVEKHWSISYTYYEAQIIQDTVSLLHNLEQILRPVKYIHKCQINGNKYCNSPQL